jgi:hypothetical protein
MDGDVALTWTAYMLREMVSRLLLLVTTTTL